MDENVADSTTVKDKPAPQAERSQAAAVLTQLRAQLAEIRQALGNANPGSELRSRLASATAQISGLVSLLSGALSASGSTNASVDLASVLSSISGEDVSGLVGDAATQSTPVGAAGASIALASADTRGEVQSLSKDVFEQHIFDSYLRFNSATDEDEFHKREAETQKYVKAQLARSTPEGNLNAGGAMEGYMLDANAHGAGKSPDFASRWKTLVTDTGRQRAAMHATGQSTEEYDRNLTNSVRRFLKAKGLSEGEIEKRLAGGGDPLDAVKPYLKNDADSLALENQMGLTTNAAASNQSPARAGATLVASARDAQLSIDLSAVSEKLKAAGVQASDAAEITPAHGLTAGNPPAKKTTQAIRGA